MAFTATMTFPGIVGVMSGNMTIGLGTSPSMAQIEVPGFTRIPREVGTLVLDSPEFHLEFPGCRVISGSMSERDTLVLTIADRRWAWRFGTIFLLANERNTDGTIKRGTEKKPQEIASALFDAMGESGADVSALPNETRPEVRYTGSNPASELESLVGALGCAVAFWGNRASLVRLGQGMGLPDNPIKAEGQQHALDVPILPDKVMAISGPGDFQVLLELEAVAETKDGGHVLIDDAPYKPATGWEHEWPEDFEGVEDDKDRELALKSVFRKYRVKREISSGDFVFDGTKFQVEEQAKRLEQILPIYSELVELGEPEPDGSVKPKSAWVEGKWYGDEDSLENKYSKVSTSFNLDGEKAIVEFSAPVYMLKREGTSDLNLPAELYLMARINVKQSKTNLPWRYQFSLPSGGPRWGTEPQAELRFDIVPKCVARYEPGDEETKPKLKEVIFNIDAVVEPDLRKHCQAVVAGFKWAPGETVIWQGWFGNFRIDGAIRQVTYAFTGDGWTTTAARNTEQSEWITDTLAERKALEEARQLRKDREVWLEQTRRRP